MSKEICVSKIDGLVLRKSGSWIIRKHHFLHQYLQIFSKGMKKKWPQLTYIDLYAGPGKCFIRGSEEEVAGSPLISLQHDFTRYIFIENDPKNMSALQERCRLSPRSSTIEFVEDDCSSAIDHMSLDGLSIAFIDPTGINFPFETLKKLASLGRVDFLMTVALGMDVKRNFDQYVEGKLASPLGRFLGPQANWASIKDPKDVIVEYKRLIRAIGYQTVEHADIPVQNEKNAMLYYLMFASRNPRGLDFWKKISKKDEKGQMELL